MDGMHTQPDFDLQKLATDGRTSAGAASLEFAWRHRRADREAALATARSVPAIGDETLRARATVLDLGILAADEPETVLEHLLEVDHAALGPIWSLRAHLTRHSVALTQSNQGAAAQHNAAIKSGYAAYGDALPITDRAMIQNELGRYAYRTRDLPAARAHFLEAVGAYRQIPSPAQEAVCLTNLGNVLSDMGDLPGALTAYTRSITLTEQAPLSDFALGLAHANVAVALERLGDRDGARRCGATALELLREHSGRAAMVNTHITLADIERRAGDLGAAADHLDAADRLVAGSSLIGLSAYLARARARLLGAVGEARRGLALLDSLDVTHDARLAAYVLNCRAHLTAQVGDYAQVVALLADRDRWVPMTEEFSTVSVYDVLVNAYEQLGKPSCALEVLRERVAWTDARRRALLGLRASDRASNLELQSAAARERAARQDANLLRDQLTRSQRLEAIGQLASGIAHDFNNLLMVMLSCSEQIADEHPPPTDTHMLAVHVLEAAERGRALTNRLLSLSRDTPVKVGVVDLNTAVAGLTALVGTAVCSSVTLDVTQADGPVWVKADLGLLEQMILNLAINARDAMPDGGTLSIRVGRRSSGGVIEVVDTGVGIPPHMLGRIFDAFFTTKGEDRGTGLGLAMVHRSAEQMGARVFVASELRVGTTFTLEFADAAAPG